MGLAPWYQAGDEYPGYRTQALQRVTCQGSLSIPDHRLDFSAGRGSHGLIGAQGVQYPIVTCLLGAAGIVWLFCVEPCVVDGWEPASDYCG